MSSARKRGRKPNPESQALRDCWAQAREEVKNKATGHADCAKVRARAVEIFTDRVANPMEHPEYGAHQSALARKKNKSLVREEMFAIHARHTYRNRKSLCEALTAIKDLDLPKMPKRLARQAIDATLRPVYDLIIKVPSPDYVRVWEKRVADLTFEEVARAAQYRGSLIENNDRPSMERFEFVSRAGHILGAESRDTLATFFGDATGQAA